MSALAPAREPRIRWKEILAYARRFHEFDYIRAIKPDDKSDILNEAKMQVKRRTAGRVTGKFSNSGDEVVAADGTRFSIKYSRSGVMITAR